jgi:hypothetical protein
VAEFDTRPVTDALQAWGERGVALMPPVVRQFIRSREIGLTVLAGLIGVASAGFVAFMNLASNEAHALLFDLRPRSPSSTSLWFCGGRSGAGSYSRR